MNAAKKPCHRRTLRLKGYDYSQAGAYFVTICVQDRVCLFGDVVDGNVRLNDAGRMVERWWLELNRKFAYVQSDAFVVMPNHIHGIIVIQSNVGADLCVCPGGEPGAQHPGAHTGVPLPGEPGTPPGTAGQYGVGADPRVCPGGQPGAQHPGAHTGAPLPEIVQWFKTMTTNAYIRHVRADGWRPFRQRLWQRNYFEHIIRNDVTLAHIRQYIADNPLRWARDRDNPETTKTEPKGAWHP